LRVDPFGGANARLTWSAAPGAAAYRVYRSAAPDGGFGLEAEVAELSYDDSEMIGDGQAWFYRVTAIDACGNEGP
jgi:fibronectin type 3 domain-containing protein